MFTGIVESTGSITVVTRQAGGRRLRVDVGEMVGEVKPGDSISVSGACLTAVSISGTQIDFDVITETLDRTTLGDKNPGDCVNLERSLRIGDRLDGHFVQGHVDGTATVDRVQRTPQEHVLWLRPDAALAPYIIPKGSITIDGVSLTIAAVNSPLFSVALIPTTIDRTTLGSLERQSRVNIETDIVVRTIIHRLSSLSGGAELSLEALQRAGFV